MEQLGGMKMEDRGLKIANRTAAKYLFAVTVIVASVALLAFTAFAQEKVRFPIGESSKTLSYGPLWIASKMGFFEREGLDVPIVTMRGSPLTIQALTADSIYVANATVDTLINAYEKGADITMIGGLINGLGLSMIGGISGIDIRADFFGAGWRATRSRRQATGFQRDRLLRR